MTGLTHLLFRGRSIRILLSVTTILIASGCRQHIEIHNAYYAPTTIDDYSIAEEVNNSQNIHDWQTITLTLSVRDVRHTLQRESSLFVEIYDCGVGPNTSITKSGKFIGSNYPTIPVFRGLRLDQNEEEALAELKNTRGTVTVYAYVPSRVMSEFSSPCVHMIGGSYSGWRVRSNKIRVQKVIRVPH